jgi:DNA (cytosine-5)-methyltransferase 1
MGGPATVGSLCTGYGGLDRAVTGHLGARLAWASDSDPAARRVIAYRLGVPDLGDIREISWGRLPGVDVLCAGFPCQPASQAGRRMGDADERWIWPDIAAVIGSLDPPPGLLVFENVPGLLSVNGGRAMAAVVGGLAALGYVGRFGVVAASDAGAPHQRKRLYIVAWLAAAHPGDRPVPERARGAGRPAGERPPVGGVAAGGAAGGGAPGRQWGQFAPAIRRWETVTGVAAPLPLEWDPAYGWQESAAFAEWMMGLPPGWVTQVPGLTRTDHIRLIGNGVVPAQAALALEVLYPCP